MTLWEMKLQSQTVSYPEYEDAVLGEQYFFKQWDLKRRSLQRSARYKEEK
ncbi:hypothetical protein CHK_0566 [Christensenella hongkongensis]|uniref:Uncharacterized protein n=1 Tax=Christensenella hongkongensis TaxID=270498 RepID=A0A0M2NI85_9FIRM|nr:hypothetical protein CHK_0566 [Christensenella hongkongensis]